jgi:hypothetical protein
MRFLLLMLCGAVTVFSQPVSIGVKAGLPFTDFVNTVNSGQFNLTSNSNRYIVGLDAELHLPFGFGVEFDALYRHFNFTSSGNLVDVFTTQRSTGNDWEFPLLAKYRFKMPIVRPFVDAGVAWSTLQGLSQSVTQVINGRAATGTPTPPNETTVTGFVLGAGVDIHALLIHVSPEIRYTRWGAQHFVNALGLQSNQNQAEFLVGITF